MPTSVMTRAREEKGSGTVVFFISNKQGYYSEETLDFDWSILTRPMLRILAQSSFSFLYNSRL